MGMGIGMIIVEVGMSNRIIWFKNFHSLSDLSHLVGMGNGGMGMSFREQYGNGSRSDNA